MKKTGAARLNKTAIIPLNDADFRWKMVVSACLDGYKFIKIPRLGIFHPVP